MCLSLPNPSGASPQQADMVGPFARRLLAALIRDAVEGHAAYARSPAPRDDTLVLRLRRCEAVELLEVLEADQ